LTRPHASRLGALTAAAVICASDAHAQAEPQSYLAAWQARAQAIGAADAGAAAARCDDLSRSLLDVPALAVAAARQADISVTPARQPALVAAVDGFIRKNCVARRAQSAGVTLRLLGTRTAADGAMLVTAGAATARGEARRVTWRLRPGAGGLRATDVTVNGVSLAAEVGGELQRRLAQSGDVDRAIAALAHG
jgi:ABC-type transporter MlaC component